MMTQTDIVLALIRSTDSWVASHQLEKVETPWGYIGTAGLRRTRELAQDGLLERKRGSEIGRDPRFMYYRIVPKQTSIL